MASWLHSRLKAAEGLLEAVDRTAKVVKEHTEPSDVVGRNSSMRSTSSVVVAPVTAGQVIDDFGSRTSSSDLVATPNLGAEDNVKVELNDAVEQRTIGATSHSVGTSEHLPALEVHTEKSCIANVTVPAEVGSDPIEASTATESLRMPEPVGVAETTLLLSSPNSSVKPGELPEDKLTVARFDKPDLPQPTPGPVSPELTLGNSPVLATGHGLALPSPSGLSPYKSKEANRRVLEQELDEARDLTSSSGQGTTVREARLLRMLERFRARLEQYKDENQQLEELLQQADARYHGGAGAIEELEDQLAKSEVARVSAEAALAQMVHTKDAEIMRLTTLLYQTREQVEALEGDVEALHNSKEVMLQKHKDDESRLIQTLRDEVSAMETKYHAEVAAHSKTRSVNERREHDLEANVAESASALAAMQRTVNERDAQLAALREQCETTQRALESLQQHQEYGTQHTTGPSTPAELPHSSEVLSLRAQCDFLRAELHKTQTARQAVESEAAALQEECAALHQQLNKLSNNSMLEQRLQEVSELLYIKQTQLERLASEKAAQQMALEREVMMVREEADRMKRRMSHRRDYVLEEVVPMDAIGNAYHKLANHQRVGPAVQVGARFVDAGASTIVRLLKQYPIARLTVFLYILFLHLSLYFLLQHLQKRAITLDHAMLVKEAQSLHH